MKKIIALLLCVLLLVTGIFLGAEYINAENTEYEGYTEPLSQEVMGVYLRDSDETPFLVYCFSNGKIAPPLLNANSILPSYHQLDYPDEKGYGSLLYAGYPNDCIGLMDKYGLSDAKAYKETQAAIWTLQNADLDVYRQYSEPFASYYLELLHYSAEHVDLEDNAYQLAYFVENENNYQSLIALQYNEDAEIMEDSENVEEAEESEENIQEQDSDKGITTMQFWLFISFAILAIIIAVIWCCIKMNRRCR
ncbi:MAG: Cys-Gln thioester bond-forming surface protein [Bacilli bacterium]|nr:Cys-Gln thioester bond-forming surface protein [Bacilli bacterium]